ncbi:hypothetical protein K9U40_10725 [Xanthobacter autotrophicus]|uniref:hypothetical protein n=1 Tax=Xanthobacter TaxID=279 RepID=UPI0024AAB2B1|nr:hypothetical protein [Xanthobacter autotrophicus]MDI4664797.1 hypothetical protein [Xanthobacter autotrophicus]
MTLPGGLCLAALATGTALAAPARPVSAGLPPFDCAGPFARDASEAALATRFGAGNVVFRTVPGPEGTRFKATVLFPRDAARRVEIVWKDEKRRQRPTHVSVAAQSGWKTADGLGIGSSLAAVEAANGAPFTMAGFGWDYGGTVTDWNGGRLARPGCRLLLRLEPTPGTPADDVDGDRDFRSDAPAMRAAQPVIYEMMLVFE